MGCEDRHRLASFFEKSQIMNILVFVGIWSLSQRLACAVTALKQPWSMHKQVAVSVFLEHFIYESGRWPRPCLLHLSEKYVWVEKEVR